MKTLKNHKNPLPRFLMVVLILILINSAGMKHFFRIDLTSEKRFSISTATKTLLKNLQDIVYIEVFLEGDLPPEFVKLKKSIREQLEEYRAYAGNKLHYRFIDPLAGNSKEAREEFIKEMVKKRLQPTNIQHIDDEGNNTQKLIFPGAIIHYSNREYSINLLKNNKLESSEANLNNSIETLEYEFYVGIKNVITDTIDKIAFLEGHNELNEFEVGDLSRELAQFFQVDRGILDKVTSLQEYKILIIAHPQQKLSEKEKFAIDQYIMHGGNVIWFVEPLRVNLDSLSTGTTVAFAAETGIEDQLFRYGVRVNPDIVKDLNCNVIPVNTAPAGQQSNFSPMPWPYYPVLVPKDDHPVTKGIDLVKTEFVSSIDTLAFDSLIRKTVLLATSPYAKKQYAPLLIRLEEAVSKQDQGSYNAGPLAVAVLLEGQFESVFNNRIFKHFIDSSEQDFQFLSRGTSAKMLVVSDGDMPRNLVKYTAQGPRISPLGFDRYTGQTFGNKDFIMNVVHFMAKGEEIIRLRAKDLKIRILDRKKCREERSRWQIINVVLPVILVILAGIILFYVRKRKYGNLHQQKE